MKKLNKITISHPLVLNAKDFNELKSLLKGKEWIEDSMIDFDRSRDLLVNLTRMLIHESAHEINLICNDRNIANNILNEVPVRLKRRIKPIYPNKNLNRRFLSLIEPVYNEEIASPAIDTLVNEFYSLIIASKEQTEVDATQFLFLSKNWDRIFKRSKVLQKSDAAKVIFNQLHGVANLYEYNENIECFIDTNREIPIDKRLEDFLNDAYVEKLSQEKYFFGIPGKVKMAVLNFKQLIKNKILPNIKLTLKPMDFANAPISLNMDIERVLNQRISYSPPIYPLNNISFGIINQYLTDNLLDRIYFVQSMPFNKAGWIVYECNKRNEIVRHLVASGRTFEEEEYYIGGGRWENVDISYSKFKKNVIL